MQGCHFKFRGSCLWANRGDDAHRDEDNHFARRQKRGADDNTGPYPPMSNTRPKQP
jgi:hypothetical protein